MELYYSENNKINQDKLVLHSDQSFGYQPGCCSWDFQIFLNSAASFILNFDTFTGCCTSCEGYLHLAKRTNRILIGDYVDAKLMIKLTQDEKDIYGCHYFLNGKMLYDEINNRVCIGEITQGYLIRFGIGQYASFDDGRLTGIIIDF